MTKTPISVGTGSRLHKTSQPRPDAPLAGDGPEVWNDAHADWRGACHGGRDASSSRLNTLFPPVSFRRLRRRREKRGASTTTKDCDSIRYAASGFRRRRGSLLDGDDVERAQSGLAPDTDEACVPVSEPVDHARGGSGRIRRASEVFFFFRDNQPHRGGQSRHQGLQCSA